MDIILHITRREDWKAAQASDAYRADTLASQGFIHCSTPEQVIPVANARFRGQEGLVLLAIDSGAVEAEIRYENLEGGDELFPHTDGAKTYVSSISGRPSTSFSSRPECPTTSPVSRSITGHRSYSSA